MAVSSQVIGHLIDEETKAEALLAEAQTEATKRLVQARASVEEAYKAQYEKIIARLEQTHSEQTTEINTDYDNKMNAYQSNLHSHTINTDAFNAVFEKLLNG